MNLVKKRADVVDNLVTFEALMTSDKKEEKEFAIKLLTNEDAIIVYKVLGENHFAPARFGGVKSCTMKSYERAEESEDKKMLLNLTSIIGNPFVNGLIVEKYNEYASTFMKKLPAMDRKFWRVKDERGKNLNLNEKALEKK